MLWDPRNSDTDSIISEMILKIQHLITEYHKKNNSLFSLQLPEKKKNTICTTESESESCSVYQTLCNPMHYPGLGIL